MQMMDYDNSELLDQLVEHEGLRLFPYKCTAGKWTIGVGRNLSDRGITEDEAYALLQNDVNDVEIELLAAQPLVSTLDPVRQRVLVDMGFNLGIPALMKFRNMWDSLEDEDYDAAAEHMLDSRWATQVGRRATRLADAMRTGIWI